MAGEYVVTVTVVTGSKGPANDSLTFSAADYGGIQACSICQSGGLAAAMVPSWSQTLDANIFKNGLNGRGSEAIIGAPADHDVKADLR